MERTNKKNTELVAIYRLEFYKKQKSWKLKKDTKAKNNKPDNNKRILNKTYDVDQPTTQSDFLNDAFVYTVSDNDENSGQAPSLPIKTDIKTEHLDNINPDSANNCFPNEQYENSHPWIHPVFKLGGNNLENAFAQDCIKTEQDMLNYPGYLREFQTDYLFDSNENLHTSRLDQLLSKDVRMLPGLDCGDNSTNFLWCAGNQPGDDCLWSPGGADQRWMNDNAEGSRLSDMSTDSWLDFMRGADMAPHSSKIELALPNALNDVDVSSDILARLSSMQLEQAVRAHTALLKRLLKEEKHRRRLRSCLSLTGSTIERPQISPRPATALCIYEQPTHDFGPYIYSNTSNNALHQTYKISEDIFVAGSYKRDFETLGRGRGRLQNSKFNTSDRFVGIGRGRPNIN